MFSYEYYIPLADADTVIYRFPTQLGLRSLALILHPFFSTAKHTSRVFVLHSSSHKITKYRDPIGVSAPSPNNTRHYIIVPSFGLYLYIFYLGYCETTTFISIFVVVPAPFFTCCSSLIACYVFFLNLYYFLNNLVLGRVLLTNFELCFKGESNLQVRVDFIRIS